MAGEIAEWVLIRGLGREAGHWGRFQQLLEASGRRALPLDLPGAGAKHRRSFPWSLDAVVEELAAEAGAPGRPRGVLALSLGAMVALTWASRRPTAFSKIVVMNTSVASLSPPWRRLRWEALVGGFGVLARSAGEAQERCVLAMTSNSEQRRRESLAGWAAIARERPVSRATLLRQTWVASRAAPELSAIKTPGTVLASRRDRLVDSSCSARLAERLGWPIRWHESAGHDLPLDDPEWVLESLI